jgi:hypothetical protein
MEALTSDALKNVVARFCGCRDNRDTQRVGTTRDSRTDNRTDNRDGRTTGTHSEAGQWSEAGVERGGTHSGGIAEGTHSGTHRTIIIGHHQGQSFFVCFVILP